MKYQFRVDGRPAAPIRKTWQEAAQDAVNAGYAIWGRGNSKIHLSDTAGAEIVRIK